MRKEFLPLAPPWIANEEIQNVTETLQSDWLSTGPRTHQFEKEFREYVAAPSALAVNSCTAALHLSMLAHNVGPGDEVITTPMTFCATANVVEHVGGTLVLADISADTLLINPKEVEKNISSKTKVVTAVHYAGHPADVPALNQIIGNKKIALVEDAAHCMPSKIGQKMVGSGNNLTTFSFYASKNMTTGEGGMLTGAEELLAKVRSMSLHGMSKDAWKRFQKGGSWQYDVPAPGYKYNMTDIQAALGLAQLHRLEQLYKRRTELVNIYNENFGELDFIRTLKVRDGFQSSHHLYLIFLNLNQLSIDRNQFIVELTERNIGTSVHYTPVHMLSYYRNKYQWNEMDFPIASQCFKEMITLPLSPRMTNQDVLDVVDAVAEIGKKFRR